MVITHANTAVSPSQGLIRQLVLVPGWDATPDVCPSSNPRLAELAVPAVLLDLPFKQTEISLALPRYGTRTNPVNDLNL